MTVDSINIRQMGDKQSKVLSANQYIVSCGYQTDKLLSGSGLPGASIVPIKGQMLAYQAPSLLSDLGVNQGDVIISDTCYMIARNASKLIVGSTEEMAFASKSTSNFAKLHLHESAQALFPGILPTPKYQWTGVRHIRNSQFVSAGPILILVGLCWAF